MWNAASWLIEAPFRNAGFYIKRSSLTTHMPTLYIFKTFLYLLILLLLDKVGNTMLADLLYVKNVSHEIYEGCEGCSNIKLTFAFKCHLVHVLRNYLLTHYSLFFLLQSFDITVKLRHLFKHTW